MRRKRNIFCLGLCMAVLCAKGFIPPAWGQAPQNWGDGLRIPGWNGTVGSLPWDIVILLTLLTFLPALLVAMTPFVRFLVIFHFLRQALSTQTTPSNQTLTGLALFLTYFVMQPVGARMNEAALVP